MLDDMLALDSSVCMLAVSRSGQHVLLLGCAEHEQERRPQILDTSLSAEFTTVPDIL